MQENSQYEGIVSKLENVVMEEKIAEQIKVKEE